MELRILKKDLKRKKSMNAILVIFIMLATMFITSSINNILVVVSGLDLFIENAGLADHIIITQKMTGVTDETDMVANFLDNEKTVDKYKIDDIRYITKSNIEIDGKEVELSSSALVNAVNINQQKFFDENNKEIKEINDSHIYAPLSFLKDNNLSKGDKIKIVNEEGFEKEFEIAGYLKDAFLGGSLMGTKRFVISNQAFEEIKNENLFSGNLYSVYTNNLSEYMESYGKADMNVVFGADIALVKKAYVMDLITAIMLLIVSICLVLIAIVMLKFTITFTINEDFKEIGVMKSIGIPDNGIRKLYVVKYLFLAVLGSLVGLFAGIPFSEKLVKQISTAIVIESNKTSLLISCLAAGAVVVVIAFASYVSTGRLKKFSPMDAIRNGNNGERFSKKGIFSLKLSKMKSTTFMAFNDVASEIKKYIILAVIAIMGIWIIVIPVNTINTLSSDGIVAWFSFAECDLYIVDDGKVTELISKGNKDYYYEYLNEIESELTKNGIEVEKVFTEAWFRYSISKGDKSYNSIALQGINIDTDEYAYLEGECPVYENEIAITHVVAEKIGASLGDKVKIKMYGEDREFIVSALYQSMNNMGEGIRFAKEADIDYSASSGGMGVQVRVKNIENEEQLKEVIDKTKNIFKDNEVYTPTEFIDSMIGGITKTLESLKYLLLVIVIIIDILVVVLMQKMFFIREKSQMGMLKAVGFSNNALIAWQTKRVALMVACGILIGTLTGTAVSQFTSGQVFKMMGASNIEFVINGLEVYVMYPAIMFISITIACMITMLKVRKIKVQDINEQE